ncbi:NAD(P)H-quinone oxidoreductase [Thermoleophilum album]|uniref:Putative NAD(P)H quinone oxidoreductase, PIG3 family n=1 Tax=Thermoleophilum album TaxID=29539 RepID=A0A1H6FKT1_THEAL|nr:NAD(P)H-quinone oxidoreductase [Thermoleophilum album]SEH10394.1 putative NAD(P)H quinone oxidoreductase, PIG3 family [Thermoleophilum album]
MRCVVIADGRLEVAERPTPEPGTGQLLVRVRAAGLNGADLLQLRGRYPAPPGEPRDIPGLELAGEVAAIGPGVRRFAVGDRVMAIVGGGGQAEYCLVHERACMPVPPALGWPEAGGFPEVFVTAHDALFTQAGLRPGERLLVHGAAGGVGSAAVQLGARAGAIVTATVRHEELREAVRQLGARTVLAPDAFAEAGPYDVVLELVGAPNMEANVRALATGGRIVVIGVGAGAKFELNLLALMGARATLRGSTLRARPLEEKALAMRAVERQVLPLVETGEVRVPIAATFPLERVREAYERFAAGRKLGKIVLTFG